MELTSPFCPETWQSTNVQPLYTHARALPPQVSAYGSVVARKDGSRVFALWIQNVNNISHVPGHAPSNSFRADMLGNFLWKYSDDQGATWSSEHFVIPVPRNYIETVNSFSRSQGGDGTTQVKWV